ncbi:hypothetical protein PV341_22235 [Streptomyces sp. PA03-1a]|nr:hypothetical protein [Streptomyces sp. PA03-1a]
MGTTQQRFMRRGVTKIYFLADIPRRRTCRPARRSPPVDLSGAITDVADWSLGNSPIDTPDLGSTLTTSIPGEDKAGDTIETLLKKGEEGFVVILRKGDVMASRARKRWSRRPPSGMTTATESSRTRRAPSDTPAWRKWSPPGCCSSISPTASSTACRP